MKGGGGFSGAPAPAPMKRTIERLTMLLDTCLALGLIAMVLVACTNVVFRYIWGRTFLWADEALIFSMIALAFLGLLGVSHRNAHLRMSIVVQLVGERTRRVIDAFEQLVTFSVCLFVAYHGWVAVERLFERGTRSNMAEVPLWLVNGLVLFGLVSASVVALLRLIELLGPQNRRHGE